LASIDPSASAAARIARLRGLVVGFLPIDEVASTSIVGAKNQVIALNFEALEAVGANGRQRLKTWAEKYVRYAAYCLKHNINVSGPLQT